MAALLAFLSPERAIAQTGMTTLQAPNLPITLVYPTAAKESAQAMGPFTLQVAPNAAPTRGNGRLVVLSHGTGGSALSDHDLARTLANAGFVVAQPEHQGDNWQDQQRSGPESWKLRPGEVSKAIDAVMADPRFAPLLDASKVGVHGMSAGGGTALALAGGQWSVNQMVAHCAAHLVDDAGFCFYGLRTAAERQQRAAEYARAAVTPQPPVLFGGAQVRDARIAAAAATVPLGAAFTADSLKGIAIPVAIVEASADQVLLPAFHSGRVLALCSNCKPLGVLPGAGHLDTLSPWPDSIAQRLANVPGFARSPNFDHKLLMASYQRIAAFFQQTLVGAP